MIQEKLDIYKSYIKELWIFSLPIIMGNIGHMLIGAGDVFIAARHSTQTLEAISIATSISISIYIVGVGLLVAISPVLSNLMGEKRKVKKLFMVSVNYALVIGVIMCLLTLLAAQFINKFGFAEYLVPMIKQYIVITAFSVFGAYLHYGLKEFLQAYEIVFLPNIISIAAIFVNLALNACLVFGFWIFPELGIVGLAIASLIVRSLMGITLLLYCIKFMRGSLHVDKEYLNQLVKVGYPISVALLLEFMGFNIITLIIGRISGILAAAHNVVLTLASITFMVPLAISNAIAVKVGYANGAKNFTELKRYSIAGNLIGMAFMGIMAILFMSFPKFFIVIFTSDPQLLAICVPLIYVAALFQIADGLQVTLGGILKGLKMTKVVSWSMFTGYWIIGIPLGTVLAFKFNMELLGYWIGLAVALFTISLVMYLILARKFRELKRIFANTSS